jgi:hypothetical protein
MKSLLRPFLPLKKDGFEAIMGYSQAKIRYYKIVNLGYQKEIKGCTHWC